MALQIEFSHYFQFIWHVLYNDTCSWSTNLSISVIIFDWQHLIIAKTQYEKRSQNEQIRIPVYSSEGVWIVFEDAWFTKKSIKILTDFNLKKK